jgi:intracellular multiplication protein IcmP
MAAQQPQQQTDNSLAAFWIVVLLFIVLGIIWYFFKAPIIGFLFSIKSYEIAFLSLFTDSLQNVQNYINNAPKNNVTVENIIQVSAAIGTYLRYPVVVILVIMGLMMLVRSNSFRFSSTYSMKKLRDKEVKNWPQIAPVIPLDLVAQDIDQGPWAMATPPMQFAKQHDLIKQEQNAAEDTFSRGKIVANLKRGPAQRIFAMQLGKMWRGPEYLSTPVKALFAIFAAKANGDDKIARKLLRQIAQSTNSNDGKLNFQGIDAVLKKYKDSPNVQYVTQRHAYVLTVMASMLKLARRDGVLASAEFLWLKPVNRPLWYMLNAVGRQTAPCEIAGVFAHWLAEIEIQRKLYVPMVEEAVVGLSQALKEIIYKPDTTPEGRVV